MPGYRPPAGQKRSRQRWSALPVHRSRLFENIENLGGKVRVRSLHSFFEVLFPVFRPRPIVVFDIARVGGRQLPGPPIDIDDIAQTFDERVAQIGAVECLRSVPAHRRPQRSDKGLGIVKDRFDRQALKSAVITLAWRNDLDGLHFVAVFEQGVSDIPALYVRRPGDQLIPIPEANRFTIPLRYLLNVLPANLDLKEKIIGNTAEKLNLMRVHHDFHRLLNSVLRVETDQSFGITESGVPLGRIRHRFMIDLLHHPLLVFGRQQGKHGAGLTDSPEPLSRAIKLAVTDIEPIPFRHRLTGMGRGAASLCRVRHQSFVVFLGGLVWVGALDFVRTPREIPRAVAPSCGSRRIVAHPLVRPYLRNDPGNLAAEIFGVAPQRPVLVEILGCEDIDRQGVGMRRTRPQSFGWVSRPTTALTRRSRLASLPGSRASLPARGSSAAWLSWSSPSPLSSRCLKCENGRCNGRQNQKRQRS